MITWYYHTMNTLTEPQKAYIAGIIDGEGCITIQPNLRRGAKSKSYSLRCLIATTDYGLMEWVQKTVGMGRIHPRNSRPGNLQGWNYVASSSMAEELLREVFPYLVVKQNQALIAFEFRKTAGLYPNPDILAMRQKFADDLKALHHPPKKVG